jgi:hypothetical protein
MSIQFKPCKETENNYDEFTKILRNAAQKGIDNNGETVKRMITSLDYDLAKQGEP